MNERKLPKIYAWRWPTLEDAKKDPEGISRFFRQFDDAVPILRKNSEFKLKGDKNDED